MGQPDPRTWPATADEERGGYREVNDDFFCHRYQVWYASFDCAVRTRFRTSAGCLNCEQGRFNHKRHAASLAGYRAPLLVDGE